MRTRLTNETDLVVAAQAGDPRALEELLAARLPFVYTIVRRAMNGDPEADDVVQETMVRALRELPNLVHPESFRAWLAAIAIRQISTHRQRARRLGARTAPLEDLTEDEEAPFGFEDVSVLNLQLAGQRRQLVRARRWLDPDDQTLLSLWWLETTGQLTRTDLAAALGVSVGHATVRVQRMRAQLDQTRTLTTAIETSPRCAGLDAVMRNWDGRPGSVWRKRLLRHVRSCPVCRRAADDLVSPEGLLVGLSLLPVPAALAAGLLGKVTAGAAAAGTSTTALGAGKAGITAHFFHVVAAHPVSVMVVTGSVIAGAGAVTSDWPVSTSTPPVVIAIPSPEPPTSPPTPAALGPTPTAVPSRSPLQAVSARPLRPGPASLESVNTGRFISAVETFGVLEQAGRRSNREIRERATFDVVRGLADATCYSFRLADGHYLRHESWRLRSSAVTGTALFQGDATFCARAGSTPASIRLESSNYPGWFLRHSDTELWVDQDNGTARFRADSSFIVRSALIG